MHPFDAKAADWDTPFHIERAAAVAAAIRGAVPVGSTTRVVELGGGTGLLGRALSPHVASVLVTDPSAGMLAQARAAAARDELWNVTTLEYNLENEPSSGERFDLAVSLMALHHVLDTDLALRHLASLLEPGGWIAVADLDAEDGSFHQSADERMVVRHGYDRDDLGRRAGAAGFDRVHFGDAWEIDKEGRHYTLFLLTARLAG